MYIYNIFEPQDLVYNIYIYHIAILSLAVRIAYRKVPKLKACNCSYMFDVLFIVRVGSTCSQNTGNKAFSQAPRTHHTGLCQESSFLKFPKDYICKKD